MAGFSEVAIHVNAVISTVASLSGIHIECVIDKADEIRQRRPVLKLGSLESAYVGVGASGIDFCEVRHCIS